MYFRLEVQSWEIAFAQAKLEFKEEHSEKQHLNVICPGTVALDRQERKKYENNSQSFSICLQSVSIVKEWIHLINTIRIADLLIAPSVLFSAPIDDATSVEVMSTKSKQMTQTALCWFHLPYRFVARQSCAHVNHLAVGWLVWVSVVSLPSPSPTRLLTISTSVARPWIDHFLYHYFYAKVIPFLLKMLAWRLAEDALSIFILLPFSILCVHQQSINYKVLSRWPSRTLSAIDSFAHLLLC